MKQKPRPESPIEEIHQIRREISDRFGGDVSAIAEDAAQRLASSGRPIWQPKRNNKAMNQSGGSMVPDNSDKSPPTDNLCYFPEDLLCIDYLMNLGFPEC